ncbi:MAG: hypothetical protein IT518_02660, partial [Burkholderiales bacterium]|nr:hypothetical protein [Burkholderiales bacterium]
SIGCCFTSDPSAVSRAPDRIDVVAINGRGEVQRLKYIGGVWAEPRTLRGGFPTGGIRYNGGWSYAAPAIAARAPDLLDVFVVRSDGRLAVTTWRDGNWGAWHTLGAQGAYEVSARPGAVALSATRVRLALNQTLVDADGVAVGSLYEPAVTFGAGAPAFVLGPRKGTIEAYAPPALTTLRDASNSRYRVVVTNHHGRVSVRTELGNWRDIGGIPMFHSGAAAVASGDDTYIAVINGEDASGCGADFCNDEVGPATVPDEFIQPGGLWIRYFQ